MDITNKQKVAISKVGKKHSLKLILVHGSCAKGTQTNKSDLDIAVLGQKPVDTSELFLIYSELERVFGNNAERELDIKTLHKKDILFLYEVLMNSKLLYGSEIDYLDLRAYAFKQFHDARDLFALESKMAGKYQNYLNENYA